MKEIKIQNTKNFQALVKYKWYIIGVLISFLVIVIVISAISLNSRQEQARQAEISAETFENNSQEGGQQAQALNTITAEDRNKAQADLANFNSMQLVDPEVEELSDRFTLFKIRQGQKYRMTINYSNIGDETMKKGKLSIKLGDGLSLVKNSMKEEISGKESVNINDTDLYNPSTNIITYGPGSLNKTSNQVLAGDTGKIVFDVEMSITKSVGDISRIYSYLNEEGDSRGKIDLVFFEVTPAK